MPTNPAKLVTDMPANPIAVHLHANMQAFCNITQCKHCNRYAYETCKPCNRHACKPYSSSLVCKNTTFLQHYSMQILQHTCLQTLQLFTCTQKCMLSATILNANLVTDMPTNPISCAHSFSLVCTNASFLQHYSMQTLQHTCLQTLQLFTCTQKCMLSATVLNARHVYKPYSCSIAHKNAWIPWLQPYRRARMHAKHEGKRTLRAPCIQNMQEIPGAGFSGQLPHSHIRGLKCMQNTRENIPQS